MVFQLRPRSSAGRPPTGQRVAGLTSRPSESYYRRDAHLPVIGISGQGSTLRALGAGSAPGGDNRCRATMRQRGVQLMVTVSGPPTQSAVDQVLSTTRCVRKGLDPDREVPRELIEDCLRV